MNRKVDLAFDKTRWLYVFAVRFQIAGVRLTFRLRSTKRLSQARWLERSVTSAHLQTEYPARLLSFVELVRPAQESAGRSQACNQTSRPLTRIRSGRRQVFRAGL